MTTRRISKNVLKRAFHNHAEAQAIVATLSDPLTLCIDSRKVSPGDVFFAMRGEFDDGHRYLMQAYEKGAQLLVAESSYKDAFNNIAKLPIVFVENTFAVFFDVARIHLERLHLTKIAITGSNGKTTTKEMIRAALTKILTDEDVYASAGNFNNHFGLPLSALEITERHRVAVFEMGMNHPQEIALLCAIVPPDIATITNISGAHAGNFKDGILGVQKAKGELFQALADNCGKACVNIDDERVLEEAEYYDLTNRVTFGTGKNADMRLISCKPFSLERGFQEIEIALEERTISLSIPLPGRHHAKNALCALSVIHALGLSVEQGALGIKNMVKTKGRMNVNVAKSGYVVINDGYNANPVSMTAGILACDEIEAVRRIAVIGAMGELGEESKKHHHDLGHLLAKHFDRVFICGASAKPTVEGAKKACMDESAIVYKDSSVELIEPLKRILAKGDLVFIKGSLSANMQAVADALKDETLEGF